MEPIAREEMYLAAAAGEYSGELPEPTTRLEYYLKKIKEAVENGSSVAPEDIDAAIEAYLNSHDADIVTEQELSDALAGYYDKGDMDTALDGKAAASHSHDDRYYTESEMDTALAGKADTGHFHAVTDVTGLESALSGKAAASHAHDDRYYTESEVDTLLSGKAAASHSHDDRYYTDSEVDTALAGKAAASHAHDDRYYTETEIGNKLGEKSNMGHTHDDRYYTEDETDTLLSGKADSSDIPDVSAFITRLVNDLVNYYTKSETYTKAEIDSKVSAIPKFAIKPVNSLPSQDISETTVYLLTVQNGEQGNMYDEYIYAENAWEKLGTQTSDLSGYYTAAEVDALLSGLSVSGHTHDDRYYTETEIDGKVQEINSAIAGKAAGNHTHDDRYYTETEIDNKLGGKSNTGHSHVSSDVTGLDSALAGKAAVSHTHAQSDITDLDTTLSGKAPASHTHTKSQITDLANASASAAGLMSAADFKKINAQSITSGSDLNDIKGEGWYFCASNNTVATFSNCPTYNAFYLEVHKHAGTYQHIVEYSTTGAKHFHRNFYNNVWGNWVEWKLTDTTYSNATPSTNGVGGSAGLMSAADKEKLDKINIVVLTQAQYDAIASPDPSTLYLIPEEAS